MLQPRVLDLDYCSTGIILNYISIFLKDEEIYRLTLSYVRCGLPDIILFANHLKIMRKTLRDVHYKMYNEETEEWEPYNTRLWKIVQITHQQTGIPIFLVLNKKDLCVENLETEREVLEEWLFRLRDYR